MLKKDCDNSGKRFIFAGMRHFKNLVFKNTEKPISAIFQGVANVLKNSKRLAFLFGEVVERQHGNTRGSKSQELTLYVANVGSNPAFSTKAVRHKSVSGIERSGCLLLFSPAHTTV